MSKKTYEDLLKVNATLKTLDVKGKEYAPVTERIKAFRTLYPEGTITTELISNQNGVCVFRATVLTDEGRVLGTGTAQENQNASFINKTSYIENCETSAVGRALGMAGIGIDGSMCSADELLNALKAQKAMQNPEPKAPIPASGSTVTKIEPDTINRRATELHEFAASIGKPDTALKKMLESLQKGGTVESINWRGMTDAQFDQLMAAMDANFGGQLPWSGA